MNERAPHSVTDCMGRIGETLKKARQLREIDLREISDATKISIRYLEAIETNRFDALPGGVFTKGFIRAYANYIGLDGQAMVDDYVHDAASGPNDATAAETHPSGLHRPTEIPQRRAPPSGPAGAGPAAPFDPSIGTGARRVGPTLRISGLQAAAHDRVASAPPDGEPGALPRIVWLVAATGLLFCILAAWRHMADDPLPGEVAEQAPVAERSSADDAAAGAPPQISAAMTPPTTTAVDAPAAAVPQREYAAAEDQPPAVTEESASAMRVTITARTATRVRVVCDGREATYREMKRGEVESLRCERLIRLSAPDASSILLAINGSSCGPLGRPANPLYGYVIRADNYRALCPDHAEGTDVTR